MTKRQDELPTILSSAAFKVPTHVKTQKPGSYAHRILTTVLRPKCALCDKHHRTADKLCDPCQAAILALRKPGTNCLSIRTVSNIGTPLCAMMNNKERSLGIRNPYANERPLESLSSAFYYQGAVAELITRWKYRSMIALTNYIANLITDALIPHLIMTSLPSFPVIGKGD